MSQTLIRVENLKKTYQLGGEENTVRALDGVNLSIDKGEYVAIMGPSGSGKSTLMQILGLLDRPSEGQYFLEGRVTQKLNDDELAQLRCNKIGFIFQFFNLLARTSCLENVALPMLYQGQREPLVRAKNLLKKVGLEDRLLHTPQQLSGGQQQRVAIARALANDPQIIFADEPTGNISTEASNEILDLLERLNKQGVTIVLVTHEPEVAARAQRLIKIRDGQVESDERIKSSPSFESENLKNIDLAEPDFFSKAKENLKMAWTALTLNKLRTSLATLGVIIGIASVVAMVGIGEGAQVAIEDQLSVLGTNLLTIRAVNPKISKAMGSNFRKFSVEDFEALDRLAESNPMINDADAQVYGNVEVKKGNKNQKSRIVGSQPSFETMGNNKPVIGRFFTESETRTKSKVTLVGQTVVKHLFAPGENPIGQNIQINNVDFRVIGVLPSKGATAWRDNDDQVVVPLLTALSRVLGKDKLSGMSVEVKDQAFIKPVTETLTQFLRKRRKLAPHMSDDFEIRNMNEIQNIYTRTTGIISSMLATIAAVSLLVGGIGIMNVMLVAVKERTREVGLRKALGAKRKDILVQFLIESMVIGLLGGIFGVIAGIVISKSASAIFDWPTIIPASMIALACLFAITVGMLFGIWPAKQASNLSPIEALRYE